jgi:hypothetical protein
MRLKLAHDYLENPASKAESLRLLLGTKRGRNQRFPTVIGAIGTILAQSGFWSGLR